SMIVFCAPAPLIVRLLLMVRGLFGTVSVIVHAGTVMLSPEAAAAISVRSWPAPPLSPQSVTVSVVPLAGGGAITMGGTNRRSTTATVRARVFIGILHPDRMGVNAGLARPAAQRNEDVGQDRGRVQPVRSRLGVGVYLPRRRVARRRPGIEVHGDAERVRAGHEEAAVQAGAPECQAHGDQGALVEAR